MVGDIVVSFMLIMTLNLLLFCDYLDWVHMVFFVIDQLVGCFQCPKVSKLLEKFCMPSNLVLCSTDIVHGFQDLKKPGQLWTLQS